MYTLIADSGSTKTDWCIITGKNLSPVLKTDGMNPFLCTEDDCYNILNSEKKLSELIGQVDKINFYGAGQKGIANKKLIEKVLKNHFQTKTVEVHSDMLGAAIALCGDEKGVCCILGTGSNSGFYNGKKITTQTPSLGYIAGDEGSGAFLGKKVLQYYYYNTFDDELSEAFLDKYGGNLEDVLDNIYNKPFANRYLASFALFLSEHRGHYMIENIIEDSFIEFHQKHILKYRESWKYPIHFVGSIAYAFKDVITQLHSLYGLETGKIIKSPIKDLSTYFANN